VGWHFTGQLFQFAFSESSLLRTRHPIHPLFFFESIFPPVVSSSPPHAFSPVTLLWLSWSGYFLRVSFEKVPTPGQLPINPPSFLHCVPCVFSSRFVSRCSLLFCVSTLSLYPFRSKTATVGKPAPRPCFFRAPLAPSFNLAPLGFSHVLSFPWKSFNTAFNSRVNYSVSFALCPGFFFFSFLKLFCHFPDCDVRLLLHVVVSHKSLTYPTFFSLLRPVFDGFHCSDSRLPVVVVSLLPLLHSFFFTYFFLPPK